MDGPGCPPVPLPGSQGPALAERAVLAWYNPKLLWMGKINQSQERVPGHAYVGPSCQVKYVFVVNKLIQFVSSLVTAFLKLNVRPTPEVLLR